MKIKTEHPEIEATKEICHIIANDDKANANKTINGSEKQNTQPGLQYKMHNKPISVRGDYKSSDRLKNKVVLITGGDSGIGRAIAYHCALESAKVVFTYYDEETDAQETYIKLQQYSNSSEHLLEPIAADLSKEEQCQQAIDTCMQKYERINILINNIAMQNTNTDFTEISSQQIKKIFETNVLSYFYMTKFCLPHMKKYDCIINTSSVTAYRGSDHLVDYASTKGAIIAFTRSLAKQLISRGIRVNAVAPGPVWTPLIAASFSKEEIKKFGGNTMYKQPAQPADIAPGYIFLASNDSLFITGQVLHPNGGEIVGG